MTFLYPNPVLQMKYSFWRINLYVLCRSGYRSKCKRCTQRWSFFWLTESDWCFKKVFHTVFDVLVAHEVFLSRTVFAFEVKENALLFCHNRQLFLQVATIFTTNFCELVHRKTFVLPTNCCFPKKNWRIKAERRRNHWRQKRVVFQKSFWTSLWKTGNFEGIMFFLCLVNEISRKSFPIN